MDRIDYLIIDDDEIFGKTLASSLTERGFTASYSLCLKEAIKLLENTKASRIILDLKLGYENGLEFLTDNELTKDSKIVVLTGYGTITSTKYAIKNGAHNFLQKPASLEEILQAFEDEDTSSPTPLTVPSLEDVEREHIARVLSEHGGNITRSAKALGLHRRSLQRKINT